MKRSPRQAGQAPNAELHRCRAGRFCEHTQAGAWNRSPVIWANAAELLIDALIEGYSVDEILALSNEQLDQFVFCGEPIVFRAGSAEILGKFERTPDRLILELAHIDGGGEGRFRPYGL